VPSSQGRQGAPLFLEGAVSVGLGIVAWGWPFTIATYDARTMIGASGGPDFSAAGRVVGVNQADCWTPTAWPSASRSATPSPSCAASGRGRKHDPCCVRLSRTQILECALASGYVGWA
jgi:hypothetical protein